MLGKIENTLQHKIHQLTLKGRTIIYTLSLMLFFSNVTHAFELNSENKEALKETIREILVENPDILEESLASLQTYQEIKKQQNVTNAISNHKEALFGRNKEQMVIGNPDAKFTLVEFFDYNCGYCKRAFKVKMELLKKYPDVRLVLKEFPILSKQSVQAAQVAIHVHEDDNADYAKFHTLMMTNPGRANLESALAAAKEAGADQSKLAKLVEKGQEDTALVEINKNYTIASDLDITATPTYIFEDEIIAGAVPIEIFEEKLQQFTQQN